MVSDLTRDLCVSIPHGGLSCPLEINPRNLSDDFEEIAAQNLDHFTQDLYNFTDLLGNHQIVFQYSPVLINVNRHPDVLDDCVPIMINGKKIYREQFEPGDASRKCLVDSYHKDYHTRIEKIKNKSLILDGHSTFLGHIDAPGSFVTEDIIVSNWQNSKSDSADGFYTSPQIYLDIYVENLQKRLPALNIAVNAKYSSTYGHVMALHGWDGLMVRRGRTPLLLQETSENLYMNNGVPLYKEIEYLRRAFADALSATIKKIHDVNY